MITVNKIDNTSVRINGHLEDLYVLREWFAKTKKNHFFDPKFKDTDWDGKIRHFNMMEKTLPYGLLGDLFDCLDAHNIGCEIEPKLLKEIDSKDITDFEEFAFKNVNPDYLPGGKCEPRDYQDEGAKLILNSKRGLLEHATRSGKSLTSFYAVNYIFNKYKETIIEKNIKIMVIVPNTGLILQFSNDYVDYGMDKKYVGRYYQKEKDDTNIIIGTWQSLKSAAKMHNDVVFAIGDECFVKDTMINTINGDKPIQDIIVGDVVLTFNEISKETEYKPVEETFENLTVSEELIEIELENGKEIRCTPNHKFFTGNRGWVKAEELVFSDNLLYI